MTNCSVCGGDLHDKMHYQLSKSCEWFDSKEYKKQARKPFIKCTRCGMETKDLDDIEDCYPNPVTLVIVDKEGKILQQFCSMCERQMTWNNEMDWKHGKWLGVKKTL